MQSRRFITESLGVHASGRGRGLHGRRRRGWATVETLSLRPRLEQRIPRGPPPCLRIAAFLASRRSRID